MLNKISSMLDDIADRLEKKGLVKEAFEIDKVADQIERCATWGDPYVYYKIKNDRGEYLSESPYKANNPQVSKFLKKYKQAPKKYQWAALGGESITFRDIPSARGVAEGLDQDTTIVEITSKRVEVPDPGSGKMFGIPFRSDYKNTFSEKEVEKVKSTGKRP